MAALKSRSLNLGDVAGSAHRQSKSHTLNDPHALVSALKKPPPVKKAQSAGPKFQPSDRISRAKALTAPQEFFWDEDPEEIKMKKKTRSKLVTRLEIEEVEEVQLSAHEQQMLWLKDYEGHDPIEELKSSRRLLKTTLVKWEQNFENEFGRKPTREDRLANDNYVRHRKQLKELDAELAELGHARVKKEPVVEVVVEEVKEEEELDIVEIERRKYEEKQRIKMEAHLAATKVERAYEEWKSKWMRQLDAAHAAGKISADDVEGGRLFVKHCPGLRPAVEDFGGMKLTKVTLKRNQQGLGLSLDAMNIVTSMLEGGPAHLNGQLRKGDMVVWVDGKYIIGERLSDAMVPGLPKYTLGVARKKPSKHHESHESAEHEQE